MSPNANVLAAASDFDSFKNYSPERTGSVAVGGVISGVPGADYLNIPVEIELNRLNTDFQVYMTTTADAGKRFSLVGGYAPIRNGSLPGPVSVPYNLFFTFERVGTKLRCQVTVVNPYGLDLTLSNETVTFHVVSFVGPFV